MNSMRDGNLPVNLTQGRALVYVRNIGPSADQESNSADRQQAFIQKELRRHSIAVRSTFIDDGVTTSPARET